MKKNQILLRPATCCCKEAEEQGEVALECGCSTRELPFSKTKIETSGTSALQWRDSQGLKPWIRSDQLGNAD